MNISLNWLKRYIELDMPVDKISEILTDIGLEVEGVKKVESIPGGLEGIVIGHVIECDKHPNADKLSLTKVDIGSEVLQIVCGAPNVAKGQKVVVATIGTTLYPAEGDSWKIKKGKIRGEESQGMICAEDELGIGKDHDGIIVLPEDVEKGTPAKSYYHVDSDHVFDIGLTPNRSDASCHIGVAQDLAAYLKINEGWTKNLNDPDIVDFKVDISNSPLKVTIENEKDAPRYSGISLSNVKVDDSPTWIKNHLNAIGVRPINNVVDITNFVLHEYGQPLHAFDLSKIAGNEIRIKNLPSNTVFKSLDDQERKLNDSDLMICDGEDTPLCIAGVFGGASSGVTDTTTDIFLESAHFSASAVRKTSTSHLLRTDAAKVFEKGSDPNITVIALKRAALLLKEYAGATINSEIVDEYPDPIKAKEIHIKYANVNRLIGTQLDKEEVHNILRSMNMELSPLDDNSLIVKVPTNKSDVLREVDVIEEILRIYGFNKVPIPETLKTSINYKSHPSKSQIKNAIANFLSANGFNEMMGLSLIESRTYTDQHDDNFVYINNTSNIHLDIMRPDPLMSGLKSIAHNLNHQQSNLRLYEFGRYYKNGESFVENEFISLFLTGDENPKSWKKSDAKQSDFYDLKKWVEQVLQKVNINGYQISETDSSDFDFGMKFHRGEKVIVNFGKVSSKVASNLSIDKSVFYAQFDLKSIVKGASKANMTTKPISKYPSTHRDLSIVLAEKRKFDEIVAVVRKTEKKLITDIELFDIYRNEEQLGQDKKSYATRFIFQDQDKTLKDKDIDKIMKSITHNLETKLEAHIRS